MKGIENSKIFFNSEGKKLLEQFPSYKNRIAVGVFGGGSECFGFDDEISKDHDLTTGFTLLLTKDDEEKIGFELDRAYKKLVKEYSKDTVHAKLSVDKFGVFTIDNYFERILGFSIIPNDWKPWFYTPEYAFSEATNGEIFEDELGIVTSFRKALINYYPNDVRLKKIAGHLALMAQSGQYNYYRMYKRRDKATCLCLSEFVNHTIATLFLLDNSFLPYYKWQFKALGQTKYGYLKDDLYYLLTQPDTNKKAEIIENISKIIIEELKIKGYSTSRSDYLEDHAISVQQHITNRQIKSLHLMDYGR